MNSEDMSFHFKFVDVVNQTANSYLDDGEGFIDFEKYILILITFKLGLLNGGTWILTS